MSHVLHELAEELSEHDVAYVHHEELKRKRLQLKDELCRMLQS